VSDARGQQANRRHFLGQTALFFETRAIGDVGHDQNPAGLPAVGPLERSDREVHEQFAVVGRPASQLHAKQRGAAGLITPGCDDGVEERPETGRRSTRLQPDRA